MKNQSVGLRAAKSLGFLAGLCATEPALGQNFVIHGLEAAQQKTVITLKNGTVLTFAQSVTTGKNLVGQQWIALAPGQSVTVTVSATPNVTSSNDEHSVSLVPQDYNATQPHTNLVSNFGGRLASAVGSTFTITGSATPQTLRSTILDRTRVPNLWPYWKRNVQNAVSFLYLVPAALDPDRYAPTIYGPAWLKNLVMSTPIIATTQLLPALFNPPYPAPAPPADATLAAKVAVGNEFITDPHNNLSGGRQFHPDLGEGIESTNYGTQRSQRYAETIHQIIANPAINNFTRHVWMAYLLPHSFNNLATVLSQNIESTETGGQPGGIDIMAVLALHFLQNHPQYGQLVAAFQAAKDERLSTQKHVYVGSDNMTYWGGAYYDPLAWQNCRGVVVANQPTLADRQHNLQYCSSYSADAATRVGDLGNTTAYNATYNALAANVMFLYVNYPSIRNAVGPLRATNYFNRYWDIGAQVVPAGKYTPMWNSLVSYMASVPTSTLAPSLQSPAQQSAYATWLINYMQSLNGIRNFATGQWYQPFVVGLDGYLVSQGRPSIMNQLSQ